MIGIAVDEAYAAVFQVDPDPAPARAHVARRGLDFVASRFVELEVLVSHMRACCRFPLRCYRTVHGAGRRPGHPWPVARRCAICPRQIASAAARPHLYAHM